MFDAFGNGEYLLSGAELSGPVAEDALHRLAEETTGVHLPNLASLAVTALDVGLNLQVLLGQIEAFRHQHYLYFLSRPYNTAAANHLANISTRGFVNTGEGQLIGGFIITGGPKMDIIQRNRIRTLADRGVEKCCRIRSCDFFSGSTMLRENDNWQSAANANDLISSGIAPENPNESAILIRLEPGPYTTVVSGVNGGTGIALVEVYEIAHQ